jgi:hypothetical protein
MKNTFLIALLPLGIAMLTALGCTKNKTMEQNIPAVCETLDIAYNDEIKAIIDNTCAFSGCHDGNTAGIGNFNTYDGLLSRLESGEIKSRAVDMSKTDPDHMPPDYTPVGNPTDLTTEQADMLLCWILDEYPEN